MTLASLGSRLAALEKRRPRARLAPDLSNLTEEELLTLEALPRELVSFGRHFDKLTFAGRALLRRALERYRDALRVLG